jgi:hypothetical protein
MNNQLYKYYPISEVDLEKLEKHDFYQVITKDGEKDFEGGEHIKHGNLTITHVLLPFSIEEKKEELIAFLKWVGDGINFEENAEKIVTEYLKGKD